MTSSTMFERISLHGLSILVMSDEGAERELLKAVFMRYGARVTAAYSTAEAIALLKRKRPDVFVADFEMAGHNCSGLLEAVKGEGKSTVPTLAIVNEAPSDSSRQSASCAVSSYHDPTLNPVRLTESIRALANGLRRKRRFPKTPLR